MELLGTLVDDRIIISPSFIRRFFRVNMLAISLTPHADFPRFVLEAMNLVYGFREAGKMNSMLEMRKSHWVVSVSRNSEISRLWKFVNCSFFISKLV